jgi:hypothetical protein
MRIRLAFLAALLAAGWVVAAGSSSGAIALASPPSYYPSGPQINVAASTLTAGGWVECWTGNYDDGSSVLSTVLAQCPGDYMLLAGGPVASSTWDVVAAAPRADVLTDTGTSNTPHNANGSGWYYTTSFSWGFAPQGSPINRFSCDTIDSNSFPGGATDGDHRLCWHTTGGRIDHGWRSGRTDFLQFVNTYKRSIYVPAPTITVVKRLVTNPSDHATFNLRIDGTTHAFDVGDGGTTGAIPVSLGSHTVSETAGAGADLSNYTARIACSNGLAGYGTSLSGIQAAVGDHITCTITNTRKLFKT